MKKLFAVLLGCLSIAFFGTLLSLPFYGIYCLETSEITSVQYKEISDWTKEFPQIKPLVQEATWDDNIISLYERRGISSAVEKIQRERYKQEAIGE